MLTLATTRLHFAR